MFVKASIVTLALLAASTSAQNSSSQSICNKYEEALLQTDGNATNQATLLTLLVNTAVIGNYSQLSLASNVTVPGILNPNGTYNGQAVNLVPYFSGALNSTNIDGVAGQKNFLDGGGAEPLMMNMPANDESSNQYFLLTHLYSFFGLLLGCTEVGMGAFPAYGGSASMYEVHKFMVLDPAEMGYFIQQVALSAQSFGVTMDDITAVGTSLNTVFNVRCAPAIGLVPDAGNTTQSICTDETCPLAPNSNCTAQPSIAAPDGAASPSAAPTSMTGTGGGMGTGTGTGTMPASSTRPPSGGNALAAGTLLVGIAGALAVLCA